MNILRHVRTALQARVPRGVRAYARDPDAAQLEAATVRGHRAARAQRERLAHAHADESGWARFRRTWRASKPQWRPIHVALGAVVLLGVHASREWHRSGVVDERARPAASGPWPLYLFGALPLNAISRAWGALNSVPLPVWFRPYGFRTYAWLFGCNMDELAEPDLTRYRSLSEFFYRELRPGARPIADAPLVSPADGRILHLGVVHGRDVEQVKGMTYSLDTLLGTDVATSSLQRVSNDLHVDEKRFARLNGIEYSVQGFLGGDMPRRSLRAYLGHWAGGAWRLVQRAVGVPAARAAHAARHDASVEPADTPTVLGHYASVAYSLGAEAIPQFAAAPAAQPRPGNQLYFCVIYLAPGDYHRFHSPTSWVVEARRHIAGELYSVSPYVAQRLPNLFLLNERVALLGRWRHGFFGMVPVGATNVGSIRINFDRDLRTNVERGAAARGSVAAATYETASRVLGGQPLGRGEEMGGFLLGSTIVLVFEAPRGFAFGVRAGERVRVGEALGALGGA